MTAGAVPEQNKNKSGMTLQILFYSCHDLHLHYMKPICAYRYNIVFIVDLELAYSIVKSALCIIF